MTVNGTFVLLLSMLGIFLPTAWPRPGPLPPGLYIQVSPPADSGFLTDVLGAMIAPREGRYLHTLSVHAPGGLILMRVTAKAHGAESTIFLYLRILAEARVATVISLDLPRRPFPTALGAVVGGQLVRQDLPTPNYLAAGEGAFGVFLIRSGATTQPEHLYAASDEDEIHVAADQDHRSITLVTAHEIVHGALWVLRLPAGHREPGVDEAICHAERQAAAHFDRSSLARKFNQRRGLTSTRECQNEVGAAAWPARMDNLAVVRTGDTARNIQAQTVADGDIGNPNCHPFFVDPLSIIVSYTRPPITDPDLECLDSRRQMELNNLATWSHFDGVIEQRLEAFADLARIRGNAARIALDGALEFDAPPLREKTPRRKAFFDRLSQRHRLPRWGEYLPAQAVFHRRYHAPNPR